MAAAFDALPAEAAKQSRETEGSTGLIAYVGTYGTGVPITGGGISVFEVSGDGRSLKLRSSVDRPKLAGHLVYAPHLRTLYAVDERKTDGRGPVEPPASVHAFRVNSHSGELTWLNSQLAPGPRTTYVSLNEAKRMLFTADHGDFDHVERVIQTADGNWSVAYVYDDSTVIQFRLAEDGSISGIQDLKVLTGHGTDPNHSPQAARHAQASAHAHSAVVDLSGQYLLVGDKGTDRVYVFRLGTKLETVFTYQAPPETGCRHIAFDPVTGYAYMTCEFSSELMSFHFNTSNGELRLIDKQKTVSASYSGDNEPAEVRAHPHGGLVYVNNRGEDSVAWFRVSPDGRLSRVGQVSLSKSIHPGLAARSFTFAPSGTFMLVADRPANLVRSYAVDSNTGSLQPLTEVSISNPAYIVFAEIGAAT